MSTIIRLDATAVRALIQDNPEFRLELQRSVTAEIVRNMLVKHAKDFYTAIAPDVMADLGEMIRNDAEILMQAERTLAHIVERAGFWGTRPNITPVLQKRIDEVVEERVRQLLREAQATTDSVYGKVMDKVTEYLEAVIPPTIKRDVDRKVLKQIDDGIEQRLDDLRKALLG